MTDTLFSLDYGERLVNRYRASGLTRKEFAAEAAIPVSTLGYYVRRANKESRQEDPAPNRILPVDFVVAGEELPEARNGIAIRLANGRSIEVERGFDDQLLLDLLAVLEEARPRERG